MEGRGNAFTAMPPWHTQRVRCCFQPQPQILGLTLYNASLFNDFILCIYIYHNIAAIIFPLRGWGCVTVEYPASPEMHAARALLQFCFWTFYASDVRHMVTLSWCCNISTGCKSLHKFHSHSVRPDNSAGEERKNGKAFCFCSIMSHRNWRSSWRAPCEEEICGIREGWGGLLPVGVRPWQPGEYRRSCQGCASPRSQSRLHTAVMIYRTWLLFLEWRARLKIFLDFLCEATRLTGLVLKCICLSQNHSFFVQKKSIVW